MKFPDSTLGVLYTQSAQAGVLKPLEERGVDVVSYLRSNCWWRRKYLKAYGDGIRAYHRRVAPYVGNPASILDIGCGIGTLPLLIYKSLTLRPNLWLLDSSESANSRLAGGFHDSYVFTAQLDITREFMLRNGVKPSQINLVDIRQEPFPRAPQDLVVSVRSWGFHYPVETYLDEVCEILSPDGRVITDVRKNTDGLERLRERLDVEVIYDDVKALTVLCRQGS